MALSSSTRASLEQATAVYEAQLPAVASYLLERGIDEPTAVTYRLGAVVEPVRGHEIYRGRLVIPYLTRAGVVSLRFRCVVGHDCKTEKCPKYLGISERTRLYNVGAFFRARGVIGITEGEMDALTLSGPVGIPAVGVPGVSNWKEHFGRCFSGYGDIPVFADGDEAGREFAKRVCNELEQARIVRLPDGMDVNNIYVNEGADALRRFAGL